MCHSYLNASIGFNFEAFFAGITPATTPIPTDNIKEITINSTETYVFSETSADNKYDAIKPRSIPVIPPTKPNKADSNKNNSSISISVEPNAFKIPISFVFSSTEVNKLFAIPIAPTSNETAAIAAKNKKC